MGYGYREQLLTIKVGGCKSGLCSHNDLKA
jgi:hypothetical protein